jgi:hypothetical protein
VIPKYARIKVPYTSPASVEKKKKTQLLLVKEEIKFLYMKKDKLNVLLYKAQIHAALEWGSFWHMIQDTIINSIHIKFADVYRTLDRKLSQLTHNPSVTTRSKHKFFQRVTNLTKINFTDEEISISVVLTYLDLCIF